MDALRDRIEALASCHASLGNVSDSLERCVGFRRAAAVTNYIRMALHELGELQRQAARGNLPAIDGAHFNLTDAELSRESGQAR
jgi:hypothetical protein